MYRAALLAGLIVTCATAASAQPTKNPFVELRKSPLLFYIVRGEDNACGLDCNEWIAAEGSFDDGAAARFSSFVARLGRRNLPVFFHSPGGWMSQAQAIGRLMRERGMTAGVARTFPEACVGTDVRTCASLKKSGKELRAEWSAVGAQCNSACVYALIGARERLVPLASRLAVHASRTTCFKDGTIVDRNLHWCQGIGAANKAELLRYVRQMGIDTALIESAYGVPHEVLRTLSRQEIVRFGIAHVTPRASAWMVTRTQLAARMVRFVKEINRAQNESHISAVLIGCQSSAGWYVTYLRPINREKEGHNASVATVIDGTAYSFQPNGHFVWNENADLDLHFERYDLLLPTQVAVAGGPTIEIRSKGHLTDAPPSVIPSSMDGFNPAWNAVVSSCARSSKIN